MSVDAQAKRFINEGVTRRDVEVRRLAKHGWTHRRIAAELSLTTMAVRSILEVFIGIDALPTKKPKKGR